jgi:hypothetical protein
MSLWECGIENKTTYNILKKRTISFNIIVSISNNDTKVKIISVFLEKKRAIEGYMESSRLTG